MTAVQDKPKAPRHLWIPASFIIFFVALAGLETWFVTIAQSTFSGLVTDNAYAIGLAYDDVVALREAERLLGWSTSLQFDGTGELTGNLTLNVTLADGGPLAGAAIKAIAERMTRFPQIVPVQFAEGGQGIYTAPFAPPLAGRWFIRLKIERGGQTLHAISEIDIAP